ncbi:MAG: hypothetical protein V7647_3000 [Acidobacteriota bacterium]|jgi:beta-lactamase regulating signal transducer with metallopeptidase domain
MTTLFGDSLGSAAVWIVLKASVLVTIAALLQATWCRRASAATRHIVWTLTLTSVLLLPVVSAFFPVWPVVIERHMRVPVDAATVTTAGTPPSGGVQLPGAFARAGQADVAVTATASPAARVLPIYLATAIAFLMLVTIQHVRLRRLLNRATIVRDEDWTRLLTDCAAQLRLRRSVGLVRSRDANVPMAFGTRRPAVIIPVMAEAWDEDRRRVVMLHELAHVARYDCLTDGLMVAACAMYWFHPLVWWIARQARIERELACDDRVIAAGTEPREYAGHLLEIAYSFGARRAPALALTMARPSQLEGRMLAALDPRRNRMVPARRSGLAAIAAAGVAVVALGVTRPILAVGIPAGQDGGARLAGVVGVTPIAALAPNVRTPLGAAGTSAAAVRLPSQGVERIGVALPFALAAAPEMAQDAMPGTWEIRLADDKNTVHLRLVERDSSSGSNVPIAELEGLTSAQVTGAGGPVQFKVRRDAGTFVFDGVMRNGVGAGTFTFDAAAAFPDELARRGFNRPTPNEQYQMARYDIGFAFVDELNRQGYPKPQTSDLVRAGQHGVQTTYLREMGGLGYRLGSLAPLITLRDHGITPSYVRELGDEGYKGLSADDLREARDHGITPDYVRGMREAGYGSLTMTELIKVRDHGVTPEYVRQLGDAGYRKLALDQVLRVRDHGVSSDYAAEMRKLGYTLTIDDLVRTRDHGISTEYVRDMAALGYGREPIEALIRVRDHGVTPEYAQELKALGYDKLPLDDLVSLRDHGLTPDRVRAANARAGTHLPIDMLKSLAAGGMH